MNIRADPVRQAARPRGLTRRQFARTAVGTAVFGGMLGSGLFKPGLAAPKASFAPVPIPGGFLNGMFHAFGPNPSDPDLEPSTITNMNGFVGLASLDGMVMQTDTTTGTTQRFAFANTDMRFMQGDFRGADGRIHQGTFALV
jgi:hypothetical protein